MKHSLMTRSYAALFIAAIATPMTTLALDVPAYATYKPVTSANSTTNVATPLVSNTGVSSQDARSVTGAAGALAQGNTRGATNIAVRAGQNNAADALVNSGVSSQDARSVTGAAGALAQGNTRGATNIAVRAASQHLATATGLPRGLTGSLLGGIARGLGNSRGNEPSSATFVQKNDYIADTDDGIIRYSADGKLSSALANLGFGNATRLTLSPEGIIKNAAGQITGRLDAKTGQLFDAAGKAIANDTIVAQRMMENISQGLPSQPATIALAAANASGIPASFTNSDWNDATRQKEWASLPPTQQAAWQREAGIKANAANLPAAPAISTASPLSATLATQPTTSAAAYRLRSGSNEILDANGNVVGRYTNGATSAFVDANGTPVAPNNPLYNVFKLALGAG